MWGVVSRVSPVLSLSELQDFKRSFCVLLALLLRKVVSSFIFGTTVVVLVRLCTKSIVCDGGILIELSTFWTLFVVLFFLFKIKSETRLYLRPQV